MQFLKVKFVFIYLIFQVFTAGYQPDDEEEDESDNFDYTTDGSDEVSDIDESKGYCNSCGMAYGDLEKGRVINGRIVKPEYKYPWIVALIKGDKIACGSALISATSVMTAAHCVFNKAKLRQPQCRGRRYHKSCYFSSNMIKLRLVGSEQGTADELVTVRRIIPHPMYSFNKQINDIAILILARPVRCSAFTSPVCIPPKPLLRISTRLITAGYGHNTPDGLVGPKVLREGSVRVINPRRCVKPKQPRNVVKRIVCAAGMESGQSSCYGDSGSAIFGRFGKRFYAVGVVSHGKGPKCNAKNPVTYAKSSTYIRFIRQVVRDLPSDETTFD